MSHHEPFSQFADWYAEAKKIKGSYPNGMMLATSSSEGIPAVRMVLMKDFDARGVVFYTNLTSNKAADLHANAQASVCFWWDALRKQVRISGSIEAVTVEEADAYFASRPKISQLGAWASLQSKPMRHRTEFMGRLALYTARYSLWFVPRPAHWSGFRLLASRVEFWQEKPFRMHERTVFEKLPDGSWTKSLLYP